MESVGFTTEMVGCWWSFTNMVGKLPNWNDCVGTGAVGTSEKSLGFSFCRFHVKKIGWNPQLSMFGRKYPMLMHRSEEKSWLKFESDHIISPPALQIIEIPAEDHPQDASIPGRFTHIPWWFFVVATMARPGWPTCCWRCVAHLWGS